jgi:MFS family permease
MSGPEEEIALERYDPPASPSDAFAESRTLHREEDDARAHIRVARKKFISMASTYSLGVLNDHFFKQSAMMIAVALGLAAYQGYGTIVFTLPFIIFAAPAGWMADRFSKRSVIIGAKVLELIAMIAGAIGIYTICWPLIFIMLFLMATQSALFSPALNGSIPELYPAQYVTKANARLRVFVTIAILAGAALAGPILFMNATSGPGAEKIPSLYGQGAVAIGVVAIALFGLVWSFGVPRFKAANPSAPFPFWGPIHTFKSLMVIAKDRLLGTCVLANAVVWGLANLQFLLINTLGLNQYKLGASTSYLMATELVGIAIGGMLAGRYCKGDDWYKYLSPAGLVLALGLCVMPAVAGIDAPHQWFFPLLLLVGASGGMMIVSMESFIQIRPSPEKKGEVWASANCSVFLGVLLSGPLFNLLDGYLGWRPTTSFAATGALAFMVTLYLLIALPKGASRSPE